MKLLSVNFFFFAPRRLFFPAYISSSPYHREALFFTFLFATSHAFIYHPPRNLKRVSRAIFKRKHCAYLKLLLMLLLSRTPRPFSSAAPTGPRNTAPPQTLTCYIYMRGCIYALVKSAYFTIKALCSTRRLQFGCSNTSWKNIRITILSSPHIFHYHYYYLKKKKFFFVIFFTHGSHHKPSNAVYEFNIREIHLLTSPSTRKGRAL